MVDSVHAIARPQFRRQVQRRGSLGNAVMENYTPDRAAGPSTLSDVARAVPRKMKTSAIVAGWQPHCVLRLWGTREVKRADSRAIMTSHKRWSTGHFLWQERPNVVRCEVRWAFRASSL